MKRSFLSLALLAAVLAAPALGQQPKYVTGAKPSSPKAIASSPQYHPGGKIGAPAQFAVVPKRLSVWGNTQFGCCVTSEECAAKIADLPNVFIPESTCIEWARAHGVLNGATLDEVLDAMARDGIKGEDGKVYRDGPKLVVNFRDRSVLTDAIFRGRVKIAVASGQIIDSLNQTNGRNGWAGMHWRPDGRTDHCVGLFGYGPASFCFEQLGASVPAGVDPSAFCYLLFTWGTIGVVSEESLLNVTTEAWARNPTTDGYPAPPQPQPDPAPGPQPEPCPAPPTHRFIVMVFASGLVAVLVLGGAFLLVRRK